MPAIPVLITIRSSAHRDQDAEDETISMLTSGQLELEDTRAVIRYEETLDESLPAQQVVMTINEEGATMSRGGEYATDMVFRMGCRYEGSYHTPYGDMELAVSDMEIYDHLTPQFLAGKEPLLNNARLVICDTNIPEPTLAWIASHCKAPVFVDPVSTAKAVKVKPVLGRLHTLKPNRIEAELLSGVAITDDESLARCADALLSTGLHRVFISLGGDGVYAADYQGGRIKVPCGRAKMVNTTGCGDAFMAAVARAFLDGADLETAAKRGLAASAIAMESADTINPAMSLTAVAERIQ